MSWTERINAMVGKALRDPQGPPGVVSILEDDYLPPAIAEGTIGFAVTAGGAGLRSEVSIQNLLAYGGGEQIAFEISELYLYLGTAGSARVFQNVAVAGFTTQTTPHVGDGRAGVPRLGLFTKNSAAATSVAAPAYVITGYINLPSANVWQRIPGFRAILNSEVADMFIQPNADNVAVGFMARWRQLERRQP